MLKSFSKTFSGSRSPRIVIAAIGKHPAWDDHIDDLGIVTDELVHARRQLYTECVAGNIDSGEWGKPDQPAPAWLRDYGHLFLWRMGDAWLAGVMWPSRDGRKRTKYPMIVVAQCDNTPLSWIAAAVFPALDALRQRCAGETTQEGVRAAVEATQGVLSTSAAASAASAPADASELAPGMARLLATPLGEGDRTALLRVLYQVEREMGAFIVGEQKTSRSAQIPRGQHLRAPAGIVSPSDSLVVWTRMIAAAVAPDAPLMVFRSLNEPWIDVVVGDLAPSLVFPIRASAEQVPPASDVPYTLTEAFTRKSLGQIDAWAGRGSSRPGAPAPNAALPTPPSQPYVPPPPPPVSTRDDAPAPSRSSMNGKMIAVGVVAVLIIGIILVISGVLSTSNSGNKPAGSDSANPDDRASKPDTSKPDRKKPDSPGNGVDDRPKTPSVASDDPRHGWHGHKRVADLAAAIRTLQTLAPAAAGPLEQTHKAIADDVKSLTSEALTKDGAALMPARMRLLDERLAALTHEIERAEADARSAADRLAGKFPERASDSDDLNAIWAEARDLVKGVEMTPERTAKLARLLEAIQQIDRLIPKASDLNIGSGAVADRVRQLCVQKRVGLIAQAAKALNEQKSNPADAEPRVREIAKPFSAWCDAAAKLAREEAAAALGVKSGLAYDDATPSGPTLRQLHESMKTSPLAREAADAMKPTLEHLAPLAALASGVSRSELTGVMLSDTHASHAKTAMDALMKLQPAWPADFDELKAGAEGLTRLKSRIDAVRGRAVGEAVAGAWLAQWAGATASDRQAALMAVMSGAGHKEESLPAWARFNLARHRLEQAIETLGAKPEDAAVQRLAREFVDSTKPWIGQAGAPAAALASQLQSIIDTPAQPKLGPADFPPAQPGESRAVCKPIIDGVPEGMLTYELAPEGLPVQRITFAPVVVGGKTIFVTTTEVSVGQAAAIIAASGRAGAFRGLTPAASGEGDERPGVRVWKAAPKSPTNIHAAAIVPASAGDASLGWLALGATASRVTQVLADPKAVPPDWSDPVQHVSPEAGMLIASAVGCRFPTIDEWKEAVRGEGLTDTPQGAQLRGRLWQKQYEIVKQARTLGVMETGLAWPNAGICWPKEQRNPPRGQADDQALPLDEPSLFFAHVGEGPGRVFKHLIGNVAEFVLAEPSKAEALTLGAIRPGAVSGTGELRVIGGSSLGSPQIRRDEAIVPDSILAPKGFSDVGFRLAFSSERGLPQQVLGKQARAALGATAWLRP